MITTTPPVPTSPATAEAKARDVQRKQDLKDLQSALLAYKKANGTYPAVSTPEQTIASTVLLSALVGTYMTALPVDPLSTTYWYQYQSDGFSYSLRSVAENPADPLAKQGAVFTYYELTN